MLAHAHAHKHAHTHVHTRACTQAAKAHGLPAFRLSAATTEPSLAAGIAAALGGAATPHAPHAPPPAGPALTASALRALLGPWATTGLGTAAGTSLQAHFDAAVAALRVCAGALRRAAGALAAGAEAQGPSQLGHHDGSSGGGPALAGQLEGLLAALEGSLPEWEAAVKVQAQPSRVLRWAGGGGAQG